MTNFDFLKSFNLELYEIGVKLEADVINSPRAVTADATLFLETLVKDIYRLSKKKLEKHLISFYKKIDNLYRLGVISYLFKNKLQDAYNLRNKIHNSQADEIEEEKIAYDLHQRLYYISKKYYMDFSDNVRANIPDYKKPEHKHIHFENCIICGRKNTDAYSNMCDECNRKIENANILVGITNTFKKTSFTKNDLISYGMHESEALSLLMDLTRENILKNKGNEYSINEIRFKKYLDEMEEYIEIGHLLTRFYSDEISAVKIKSTLEYWKGGINQKPFAEFYKLVNRKLEENFENCLCESENIKRSINKSSMDNMSIAEWFSRKKEDFLRGELNEAFILYNEILIKDFFKLKRKNVDEAKIKNQLEISDELYQFWQNEFMGEDFQKKTTEIKKELIIKEIKKNKTLKSALQDVGISEKEFNKIYLMSKNSNDEFYTMFCDMYTRKRQKTFIKHLRHNSLYKSVRLSKITLDEFFRWYYDGELNYSEFYLTSTELLMEKYLSLRRKGWGKQHILNHMGISKKMIKSWMSQDDLDLTVNFKHENSNITSTLIKKGRIINALKEDKSKSEAISLAKMSYREFLNIYNSSKIEESDFYKRFDEEYAENRKRLFPKILKDNDFYIAIQKCDITQKQFNEWYQKDQDKYIATYSASQFYIKTTKLLMEKYLDERRNGKNKPNSAKAVGISNSIVNKWINHVELDLFWQFKKENDELEIDLIKKGFMDCKSKGEIAELYDISPKTIDQFILLARNGFEKFSEVFSIYESKVIPHQIGKFMKSIKNKPFTRALKDSKFTIEEFNYYYDLGKMGDENFIEFYTQYLDIKMEIYASSILSKKSEKIAFKNSNLTSEEFEENKSKIQMMILNGRVEIMMEKIEQNKNTGIKLAKALGITVDEIYECYIRGKNGDEKYGEFAFVFELGVIIPRTMALSQAMQLGISKNQLHKNLKKELGKKEYDLWDKYGIIDRNDKNYIKFDGEIDQKRIKNFLKNSQFINSCFNDKDSETFEFMKKAVQGNSNFDKNVKHISKRNFKQSDSKMII